MSWHKEFDDKFAEIRPGDSTLWWQPYTHPQHVKAFISQVEADAYERGLEDLEVVKSAAYERAAKVVEDMTKNGSMLAKSIRSLKDD